MVKPLFICDDDMCVGVWRATGILLYMEKLLCQTGGGSNVETL